MVKKSELKKISKHVENISIFTQDSYSWVEGKTEITDRALKRLQKDSEALLKVTKKALLDIKG